MAGVSVTNASLIKQQASTTNLDPHEWDFRGVNPDHLDSILLYEQSRESVALARAKQLLTSKNRRRIFGMKANEFGERHLASKIVGTNLADDFQFFHIVAACWLCNEFPKPWMALSGKNWDEAARRYTANKWLSENMNFRVLSRAELAKMEDTEEWLWRISPDKKPNPNSPTRLIIQIDWAKVDDRELKTLLLNLLKLRPDGVQPRKISTGKRAAAQIHKLKQLAAWRLSSKAKLNFQQAHKKVAAYQKAFPVKCDFDLLPNYASAGAWSDAVMAGKKLIRGF